MFSNVCVSAVQDNTGALLQEEDFVVDKETGRAQASARGGLGGFEGLLLSTLSHPSLFQ